MISRKWISDITSTEETSIQVQAAFIRALRDEGLAEVIAERNPDGSVPYHPDDDRLPVLWVLSDNGPQMSSGSTREFMALSWLATHYGRPGTPTDQAWIESFFGHLKGEFPHLDLIEDIDVLRAELDIRRTHYNQVRLHAGIGYVTPDQEHRSVGSAVRKARREGLVKARRRRIDYHANNHTPGVLTMRSETSGKCDIKSDTPQCRRPPPPGRSHRRSRPSRRGRSRNSDVHRVS